MFILWCLMTRKFEKLFCRISLILYILGNIKIFIGSVRSFLWTCHKHPVSISFHFCLLWIPIGEQWLFLRPWFSSTDSVEDELEMATVRHRPEALELLEAQSKFTKKELQILYRGFKNVRTFFLTAFTQFSEDHWKMRGKSRKCAVLWYLSICTLLINLFYIWKLLMSIWTLIHFGTLSLIQSSKNEYRRKVYSSQFLVRIFFFPFSYIAIISISSNIYKFSCV